MTSAMPLWILILGFCGVAYFLCAGALLSIDPALYVRFHRRLMIGDYYARSREWEEKMVGPRARILGFIFLGSGLFFLYGLLKVY